MRRDDINLAVIVLLQVVLIWTTSTVVAFSKGAPDTAACRNMSSKHNASRQVSPSPYNISVSSVSYSPRQIIQVRISGSELFKGFILQSRTGNGHHRTEGSFVNLPETAQYIMCNTHFSNGSTITHTSNTEKEEIEVDWLAPDQPVGEMRFYATIVQNVSIYWEKLESSKIIEIPTINDTQIEGASPVTTIVRYTLGDHGNDTTYPPDSFFNTSDMPSMPTITSPVPLHHSSLPVQNDVTALNIKTSTVDTTTRPTTSAMSADMKSTTNITVTHHYQTHQSAKTNVTDRYETTHDAYINQSRRPTTDMNHYEATSTSGTLEHNITTEKPVITLDFTIMDNTTINDDVTAMNTTMSTQTKEADHFQTSKMMDILTTILYNTSRPTSERRATKNGSDSEMHMIQTTHRPSPDPHTVHHKYPTRSQPNETVSQPSNLSLVATAEGMTNLSHLDLVTTTTGITEKGTSVLLKLTITSIEFSESLLDTQSKQCQELTEDIIQSMWEIYNTNDGFNECIVVGHSQGSVITETELIFQHALSIKEKSSTVSVLYTLVEESGGIGNYTVSDIQAVSQEGIYITVDACFLLPCPSGLYCSVIGQDCILSCEENPEFCPLDKCSVVEGGKNLNCSNYIVTEVLPVSSQNVVFVVLIVGICALLFVLALIVATFIVFLRKKRRQRNKRKSRDIQLFGFEDNKHTRLNGGVSMANMSGSRGRYFVEIGEPHETPFFTRHPTNTNLSGRYSSGSLDSHSIFDRALSIPQRDIEEPDCDYDVINRRSVTFRETPQMLGDDRSHEGNVFGIENFSFGVPKYVETNDTGGSYRVRWDFKVDTHDSS